MARESIIGLMTRTLRRLVAVSGVLVAISLGLSAQPAPSTRPAGHPLTIEDYYRVLTVGAPAFSPDGRWISFTVSTRVEETNGSRSAAYVVPTDGSREERAITHDGKDVTSASWTSDNQLRYVIDGQTWTADPAGTSHVLAPTSEPSVGTG